MKRKTIILILLLLLAIVGYKMIDTSKDSNTVLLKTNHGNIKIKLYEDMAITSGNFKNLV